MLKGKKILITGASGYIGSWLAEYAFREGADVRILLRKIPPHLEKWASKFEINLGDITSPTSLQNVCAGIEFVWHAASANETICSVDFENALQINVTGTKNILEASLRENVKRFIKLSTFHVYGVSGREPVFENTAPFPTSIYGLTNLMGDLLSHYFTKAKSIQIIVARISNGYGAPLFKEIDRWSLVMNDLCRMAFREKKIVLKSSGVQQRDFVAISDIFSALSLLSTKPTDSHLFHVGGAYSCSIFDMAKCIQELYNRKYNEKIPLTVASSNIEETSSPVQYDISNLQSLGYCPKNSLETEINRIFDLLGAL